MDLDGNGATDLLSGSYSNAQPMAGHFQVLRRKSDGTFKKAEPLCGADGEPLVIAAGSEEITVSICTRPFAVDWTGDGNLDLVVGNFAGTFYLFKGEGEGKFRSEPEQIMTGNEPLKISGVHSDPFLIDLDGDGDLDIVSGSSDGSVQWAENVAGPGNPPELKQFRTLIPPTQSVANNRMVKEEDLKGPVSSTRVWVEDVNGNGKLDILVGDSVTLVSPAEGLSEKEFQTKYSEWEKDYQEAVVAYSNNAGKDEGDRADVLQKIRDLYQKKSTFMNEEMTGFVWVYLGK